MVQKSITENQNEPLHHIHNNRQRLQEEVEHLRSDIDKIDEPRCKAMFETSAEVLKGLIKTFNDYENKSEPAWK